MTKLHGMLALAALVMGVALLEASDSPRGLIVAKKNYTGAGKNQSKSKVTVSRLVVKERLSSTEEESLPLSVEEIVASLEESYAGLIQATKGSDTEGFDKARKDLQAEINKFCKGKPELDVAKIRFQVNKKIDADSWDIVNYQRYMELAINALDEEFVCDLLEEPYFFSKFLENSRCDLHRGNVNAALQHAYKKGGTYIPRHNGRYNRPSPIQKITNLLLDRSELLYPDPV